MALVTRDPFTHKYRERKHQTTLTPNESENSKERRLHIAVINAMPEGAVLQTPAQLAGPMAEAAGSRDVVIHNFFVDGIDYGRHTKYVQDNYHSLDKLNDIKPDIIIVSGSGHYEALLPAVKKVLEYKGATSTIFSCMAGHALFEAKYKDPRKKLEQKKHGVFAHETTNINHPFTQGISSNFNEPHSRWNAITWQQALDAKMKILAYTEDSDVFIATSEDGISEVFIQGHPEYSKASLLKEFNRDIVLARFDEITRAKTPRNYPPHPENYLIPKRSDLEGNRGKKLLEDYVNDIKSGKYDDKIIDGSGTFKMPTLIENKILQSIPDTSASVTFHLFANIVKTVFDVTNFERGKPFMDNLDPNNPCNIDMKETLQSKLYLPENSLE